MFDSTSEKVYIFGIYDLEGFLGFELFKISKKTGELEDLIEGDLAEGLDFDDNFGLFRRTVEVLDERGIAQIYTLEPPIEEFLGLNRRVEGKYNDVPISFEYQMLDSKTSAELERLGILVINEGKVMQLN